MTPAQPPCAATPRAARTVTPSVLRARRRGTTTSTLALATALVAGLLVTGGSGTATAGPHPTLAAAPLKVAGSQGKKPAASPTPSPTRSATVAASPTAAPTTTAPTTTAATTTAPTTAPTTTAPRTTAPATTAPATAAPATTAPATTAPVTTAPATTTPPTTAAPTSAPTSAPATKAPTAAPTTTASPATTTAPAPTTSTSPVPTPTLAGARTTLPLPRSSWGRPTLVDPIVWRPSVTDTTLRNAGDRDVLVVWPDTPLDVEGGFQINGGRNIVSVGGTIKPSRRYFAPGETTPNDNRCLYIGGSSVAKAPRTIHIEGLHCAGAYVWEGINIDSKAERGTLTVQMRDVRVDEVQVDLPGGLGNHYGGDALQTWNGPHRLLIDGFTAKNLHYQGFFLQPFSFGSGALGRWDFRNLQLEGSATGSSYLVWLSNSSTAPLSYGVEGVYVAPSPGDTRTTTVWHSTTDFTQAVLGAPAEDIVGFSDVGAFASRGW